ALPGDERLAERRLDDLDARRRRREIEREVVLRLVGQRTEHLDGADRPRRLHERAHPRRRQVVVAAIAGAAPRVLDDEEPAGAVGRAHWQLGLRDVTDREHGVAALRALAVARLLAAG